MNQPQPITGIIIPPRKFPLFGLVLLAVWAGIMLYTTSGAAFFSVWAGLFFLGILMLAGSGTRTVTHQVLLRLFFGGVFCASIAYFLLMGLSLIGIGYSSPIRPLAVAIVDGALMLAPLFLLLRRVGVGILLLGATDLTLMAAACGTGYGFIEHAHIAHRMPSVHFLAWLPLSGIATTPRDGTWMLNTHGVLCGLAGATLGLGLLFSSKGKPALILGASGFVIAFLDHLFIGNLAHDWSGAIALVLAAIVGWGWLTLGLFIAVVICAIAVDAYIINKKTPERVRPLAGQGASFTKDRWDTQLEMRAVAFGAFQHGRRTGSAVTKLNKAIFAVVGSLVNRYKRLHPEFVVRGRAEDKDSRPAVEEAAPETHP